MQARDCQPISYSKNLFPNKIVTGYQPKIIRVDNTLYAKVRPSPRLVEGGFNITEEDIRERADPVARLLVEDHEDQKAAKVINTRLREEMQKKEMFEYFLHENRKRRDDARNALVKRAYDNIQRQNDNANLETIAQRVDEHLQEREIERTLAQPPTIAHEELQHHHIVDHFNPDHVFGEQAHRDAITTGLMGQGMNLSRLLGGYPKITISHEPQDKLRLPIDPNITLPDNISSLYSQFQGSGGIAPVRNNGELQVDIFDNLLQPHALESGIRQRERAEALTHLDLGLNIPIQSEHGVDFRSRIPFGTGGVKFNLLPEFESDEEKNVNKPPGQRRVPKNIPPQFRRSVRELTSAVSGEPLEIELFPKGVKGETDKQLRIIYAQKIPSSKYLVSSSVFNTKSVKEKRKLLKQMGYN
jgi:hypothetical protein